MVGFQHSDDETSSGSIPHHPESSPGQQLDRETPTPLPASSRPLRASSVAPSTAVLLDDVQFDPHGPGLEPRMQALSISNDALRDSLRPARPPSLAGWLEKQVEPWWHHVEHGYTEATYWLWARAPWQRWALSGGLGAVLGLAVVAVVVPRVRPESSVVTSTESLVASTRMAAASAVLIAPPRPDTESPAVDAPKSAEPPLAADGVKLPEPDAPSAVEVADPAGEEPAADAESPSKKGRHRKKHSKPKSASSLSQLFLNLHRSRERAAH